MYPLFIPPNMKIGHNILDISFSNSRSPDGESNSFPLGQMSIQQAAATVLDRYNYPDIRLQKGIWL